LEVASQVGLGASTPVMTGPGYDIDEIVATSIALGAGSTGGALDGSGIVETLESIEQGGHDKAARAINSRW
jgi:hypothetical protein